MAKKKVTRQADDHKEEAAQPQEQSQTHQAKAMDEPSEKLQNLRSLNSLLLKETFERRQQVESLEQAKQALEAELTRSGMEKKALEAELTWVSEEGFGLELEKSVVCAFWETQMVEMAVEFDGLVREKGEIEKIKCEREAEIGFLKKEANELVANLENDRGRLSRVCRERDLLKTEVDGLVQEANGLRKNVVEMEKKDKKTVEEFKKLKVECEGLLKEKLETEKVVKVLKREKESVQGNLEQSVRVVSSLTSEIEGVMRAKSEVERERTVQEVKIGELEKEVRELNGTVMSLRQEEEVLRAKVLESEKMIGEAMDKEKEMVMEINVLVEEKREKEQNIEELKDQRDSVQRILIWLARNQRGEEEKNKQLVFEAGRFRDAFDRLTLERDKVQKGFDEEKKKVKSMEVVVLEKEKRIEETVEELGQMRSERENLIERNKAIESRVEVLVKEKDLVQKNLVESQQNTAALVCHSSDDRYSKEEVVINEQKLEEQIQPYAVELDTIKNAFRNKEKMIEDMKKQLDFLQNSVAEAHKRKSFWTFVSSATTIVAAASVAYVARGR
ncbi:hypothetical protein SLA2020_369600 [Shorea laevis]